MCEVDPAQLTAREVGDILCVNFKRRQSVLRRQITTPGAQSLPGLAVGARMG